MRFAVALLALGACAIPEAPERSKAWAAPTFFEDRDRDIGGFPAKRLAVKAGEEIPWRPGTTASIDAIVVHPAYLDGAPSAYVVTEVWQRHPDLWVQPVYLFVSEYDATDPFSRLTGADNVFGVGTDSTFYSPFWRAYFAEQGDALPPFTSVRAITDMKMHEGGIVTCPIVPPGTGISSGFHPFTGAQLQEVRYPQAYVNGRRVSYLNLGANRQEVVGENRDLVRPELMFFFAALNADGSTELLDIPAVLPHDAHVFSYVRRVDVVLTPDEAVFVPASRPDLRASLSSRVNVPPADAAIPDAVANAYLMRVAKDGACFANAASFPAACEWIDSAAAVRDAIPETRRLETDVTLAATAVLPR